jgi:hypothetical protein
MGRIGTILTAIVLTASAAPLAARADEAATVKVTIKYTGKGTVDSSHRVWVWLFTSPDIGPGSMPIAQTSIDKNGTAAIFEAVDGERVWIAVAFDEQGVMTGDGPPPAGTPIGLYVGSDGAPRAVTPGDTADATLVFDDSLRMP